MIFFSFKDLRIIIFSFQNATVNLEWSLFEQQSLQEDGSIVILFRNKENGKDPQQIHIMTIYVSIFLALKILLCLNSFISKALIISNDFTSFTCKNKTTH